MRFPLGPGGHSPTVKRTVGVLAAGFFLAGSAAGQESAAPESAAPEGNAAVQECLSCHGHPDAAMTLEDGTTMSLYTDAEVFAGSVHGNDVVCTDCHEGYETGHPRSAVFPSRRDYVLGTYQACRKCHFDSYTRSLESVHYALVAEGRKDAPVCSDCHGAHDIHNPHEKRTMLSRSCATCHDSVYREYAESVHGHALIEDHNNDLPACADCHEHHRIDPSSTAAFRMRSPEICIGCHGDKELMSRYGISTTVADTYLTDFHGVTASLDSKPGKDPRAVVLTCVDCHGVHDIQSPAVRGDEEMKAAVAATCVSCHETAAPDFPAAWLSHYEPSLQHAPLVYIINLFYRIFIPFIVIGLVLQVMLHLYRVSAGR